MDLQILSLGIGLIAALLFSEMFGLAAGGMIVPGYMALYLDRPGCLLLTIAAALITYALLKLVSQNTLVYGRRRITLMLLFGFVIGAGLRAACAWCEPSCTDISAGENWPEVIGFVIPGLIALSIDRQGLVETLAPLATLSVAVRLGLIVIGAEVLS